jgi:hypothetical protein
MIERAEGMREEGWCFAAQFFPRRLGKLRSFVVGASGEEQVQVREPKCVSLFHVRGQVLPVESKRGRRRRSSSVCSCCKCFFVVVIESGVV